MRPATLPLATSDHVDILIVDSHPEDYARFAAAMAGDRFVFQFAASGQDALQMRPTSPSALWLINVDLPDMSGFDLYELLRRRPGTSLCLVGNRYRLEDELQSRSCGATMYACKPALPHWLAPWSRRTSRGREAAAVDQHVPVAPLAHDFQELH